MKKSHVLFLMISISALTLVGRDIFNRFSVQNIARAQSTEPVQSGPQTKWEYCALYGYGSSRQSLSFGSKTFYATIEYYQTSDSHTETVEMDRGSEEKVIAKAIAKLGEEGWEMIIDRTHEGTPLKIYFKRPKQ